MTILVTGGTGLVGSHVLDALRARSEPVRALVRDGSQSVVEALGAEPVMGDVTDPRAWQRGANAGLRGIVHAAALVAPRAPFEEFERVNVGGTRLAIDAARSAGARLIHVSSVAVYGRSVTSDARRGIAEDFPLQPLPERNFYARTKRMAEEVLHGEAARGGLSAAAIRPNVIYGERDRLFTPRVVATVRRGILPQVGPGTNHLSCVYAGNVASAIVAALDAPVKDGFRAYNVTQDAPPLLTQREFLAAFGDALGVRLHRLPIPILLARLAVNVSSSVMRLLRPRLYAGLAEAAVWFVVGDNPFSMGRIRAELGWNPPFDARSAIQRTAQSFS